CARVLPGSAVHPVTAHRANGLPPHDPPHTVHPTPSTPHRPPFGSPRCLARRRTMIEVFYWPPPNGRKVTILVEEADLPYKITPVNSQRGDQFAAAFLRMNPNHRMPVIVDHAPADGGAPISVFESGAIMMYIAEKTGRFWPTETRARYEVAQWLMWQ